MRPAGATSTFSDGFNVTSAALPTEPTGYGVETIAKMIRGNPNAGISPDFSLIKGFHRIGTGVSTAGNGTFYGNDIVQRARSTPLITTFKPLETPTGYVSNLNIGTSIGIVAKKTFNVNLGLSGRYNKMTNTFGGGPGLVMSTGGFTWGGGITQEKVSNYWDKVYFLQTMVSMKFGFLELEYNYLKNMGAVALDPVHIGTLSITMGHLLLVGAARHLNYLSAGEVTQFYFSTQYLFGKAFSLGFLYNYVPGTDSLAFQIYF